MRWKREGIEGPASSNTNRRRSVVWRAAFIALCFQENCGRRSVGPPTVKGGGVLLPGDVCTKTGRTVEEVCREKHPDMRVPPAENRSCAAFEEYKEVL